MSPARGAVPAVSFLSDYGWVDEFVGVVHAVLHRLAPGVPVVDLCHGVAPFDVAGGAAMLARCASFLPSGVVLAVVDPGVGTDRRPVAVGLPEGDGDRPAWLVGPDNGLLVPAATALGGAVRTVVIERVSPAAGAGPTFDGRDRFAPAAVHLVQGGDPGELGPDVDPASLAGPPGPPSAADRPDRASGGDGPAVAVRWVDRFGNVQLDLRPDALDALGVPVGASARLEVTARSSGPAAGGAAPVSAIVDARRVVAFAELTAGELGLLVDSAGWVAVVADRDSAAGRLGLGVRVAGATVRLRAQPVSGA